MDYIYAKFHQILTTLLVDAYYGALHASLQDWVLIAFYAFFTSFETGEVTATCLYSLNH